MRLSGLKATIDSKLKAKINHLLIDENKQTLLLKKDDDIKVIYPENKLGGKEEQW